MNISPNIYMFHRIKIEEKQYIPNIYYQRNMVHNVKDLFLIFDSFLEKGKHFGSIEKCINSEQYFHLSFDDGYKEHLAIARKLKEKYCIKRDHVTFSINFGNSFVHEYTGMDVVYYAIIHNKLKKLKAFLKIPDSEKDINLIKQTLIKQPPEVLKKIPNLFKGQNINLSNMFLEKNDIIEISKNFNIACHGMTHRDMTKHIEKSRTEILVSKKMLEKELNQKIKIITYPEGKNNEQLQKNL